MCCLLRRVPAEGAVRLRRGIQTQVPHRAHNRGNVQPILASGSTEVPLGMRSSQIRQCVLTILEANTTRPCQQESLSLDADAALRTPGAAQEVLKAVENATAPRDGPAVAPDDGGSRTQKASEAYSLPRTSESAA